jgi:hypothetical protein
MFGGQNLYCKNISKTIGETEPVEYNAAESQLLLFSTKQRLDVAKHKATCGRQGSLLINQVHPSVKNFT